MLGVPAEAGGFFEGRLLPDAHPTGFFEKHDFEIPETEPGGVQHIMVMKSGEFREQISNGGPQFFFGVRPDGKGFL